MTSRSRTGAVAGRVGWVRWALVLFVGDAACGGPLPIGDPPDGQDWLEPDTDTPPPRDDGGTTDDARDTADVRTDVPADVPVTPCSGQCTAHSYTACTCAASDPCGWSGDGLCDDACDSILPSSHFDDTTDCGPPPVCGGDCDARRYSACSCGSTDPCGWAGNGVCDGDACAGVSGADFDDTADCGTPGDLTYAVTAVSTDGLDSSDFDDFASGFAGLGYSESVSDRTVTWSNLVSYLGRDITTLYHTGHGNEGLVMTADGYLMVDEVPGGIRVQNTIFATCLTLSVSWASAFGSTAQSVLGYTNYSYDYVDNDVVREMIPQLRSGRSFMYAWYQANAGFDMLYDRWAGYVREGGSIVEYSARTGRTPSEPLHATWIELPGADDVWATDDLLADGRTFAGRFAGVRALEAGEPVVEADAAGLATLAPTTMSAAEAEVVARSWLEAHGGLPADAVPGVPVAVEKRGSETEPGVVVGWLVRYVREAAGLPVRGNLVEHHIAVLVGPSSVVSVSRFWPPLAVDDGLAEMETLLPVSAAVRVAAGPLARAVKGAEVRLVGATPVYGTRGRRAGAGPLVPAYALRTTQGFSIVVDAATGEPLF